MDRAQLLDYYSANYLSRQEILFRLPFNIPADSFWQELVDRRKMRAVILPLYNARGMPYWYCLTDKMVKASEILCEEAMKQGEFDPYRMEMTTAMTWEMFFTSFVEGAEIEPDAALDYLSRDSEPSNVQEQLLWNNRQAIYTMVSNLYRPVNEDFLLHLAYLLTQDLDQTADGYRQTDTHPIAAMEGENYLVPAVKDIPARMDEFYSFLAKPDIHPLIKAAAAQAFILAARPFPDGNERLSRMVSALILYRSGYDYFRDIAISRKIARESYRYYKNMREILRQENDADMTCFLEYYIDLLARALTEAKEEAKRREAVRTEETVLKERQMAAEPFPVSAPVPEGQQESAATDIADVLAEAEPVPVSDGETENAKDVLQPAKEPAAETMVNPEFWSIVENFCTSFHKGANHMGETIKKVLGQGIRHFSVEEWAEYSELDMNKAKNDCYYMRKRGLVVNLGTITKAEYHFRLGDKFPQKEAEPAKKGQDIANSAAIPGMDDEFRKKLDEMQNSPNAREARCAGALLRLMSEGRNSFGNCDWSEICGITKSTSDKDLRDVINMGLVYRTGDATRYVYHVGRPPHGDTGLHLSKTQREILEQLCRMTDGNFTASEAAEMLGMKQGTLNYHLKYIQGNGDIVQLQGTYPPVYCIKKDATNDGGLVATPGDAFLKTDAPVAAGETEMATAWA